MLTEPEIQPWRFVWTLSLTGKKERRASIRICNFGSSSGALSFDYEPFTRFGRNWGIAPQTIGSSTRMLAYFGRFLAPDAQVILPLSPFDSCLPEYDSEAADAPYYPLLPARHIRHFSIENKRLVEKVTASWGKLAPDARITMDSNSCAAPGALEADAAKWLALWRKNFSISDLESPLPRHLIPARRRSKVLFRRFFSVCRRHGWRVAVVVPPVTTALASGFSPAMRETYIDSFLREVLPPDVPVLDFLDDPRWRDPAFYCDSFLLNAPGRRRFTECVLARLDFLQ